MTNISIKDVVIDYVMCVHCVGGVLYIAHNVREVYYTLHTMYVTYINSRIGNWLRTKAIDTEIYLANVKFKYTCIVTG